MTADTQSQIDAIFNQVAAYNQTHDTSKPLFFDTETTSGGREDQIIEIAFCDSDRHVIIDTLIYTDRPSSTGAFKVHGIYPHELIGKPTFIDIQPAIVQLLKGRTLYAYNASFDIRMMRQSGHKLRLQQVEVKCLCPLSQNSCHPHPNNLNGGKGDNHGTIQSRTQTSNTKQTAIA